MQIGQDQAATSGNEVKKQDHEIVEHCIGVLGRWHVGIIIAIFLCKPPVAWHQMGIIFLAPRTKFHCEDKDIDKCSSKCTKRIYDKSIFKTTIISEWDLVCDKEYLTSLTQTITMLGILVGSMVFGYISDRFGRKNPLTLSMLIQVIAGVSAAFSPWFGLFLFMRFVAAVATGGGMVMSFVLLMEIIGTKWRTVFGVIYQIPFNVGHLTLPLLSYLIRDWRYFHFTFSIIPVFLISYYWILPESPRYLLTAGRKEEAIKIMERAAKKNKMPVENVRINVDNYLQKADIKAKRAGNIIDLFKTKVMRIYTICICYNWFVCGFCFFGVSQYIGQLAGNIFINVTISALITIPGTLFALYSTKYWGRKWSLIVSNILSAVIICVAFTPKQPSYINTIICTIDIFGLFLEFTVVYIYSGELFPTFLRNTGVGTSSTFARIGSMIAPFVANLVTVKAWLPPVIFGVIPIIGALLCIFLPETLDCTLPDTIEEAEHYYYAKKK